MSLREYQLWRQLTIIFFSALFCLLFPVGKVYSQHDISVTHPPRPASPNAQQIKNSGSLTDRLDAAITIQTYVTNATCQSGNGSIVTEVHGGVPPYQFSLNGGDFQSSGAFYYLPGNDYTITVKDATGTTANTTVTVANTYPAAFGKVSAYTLPSDCVTTDASVTIQPTIGTPPFTYSLDLITFQTSNTFTNVAPGSYTYYLKDAHGCLGSIPAMSLTSCNFSVASSYTGSECGSGGIVNIQDASDGNPPYTYSIDGVNYGTGKSFQHVPPGLFTIYVKDANGRIARYTYQMSDFCSIVVQTDVTPSLCQGASGSIVATATNGTPPYQYSIDGLNYQVSNRFDNLFPAGYTVLVKDSKGDIGMTSAVVKGGCLTMVLQPFEATCTGSDGKITVHANGGTEPYRYSLDGTSFQNNNTFTGLKPGDYSVTAKDADGLVVTGNITVGASIGPMIKDITTTPASCTRDDGTLTIIATGGTPPLQYGLDQFNFQPSSTFTNLQDGWRYQGFVKDANGCVFQRGYFSVEFNCILAETAVSNATCGASNGSVTVTVTHGMPPYQYSLDGVHYQTSNVFENLGAGDVTVTVKDNGGLVQTVLATVGLQCVTLQAAITNTSCGDNNGRLIASASNGTAPYQYSLDGIHFQNTNSFINLPSGSYSITVKDATGTVQTQQAVVESSRSPQATVTSTAASCADEDGGLTVAAVSGSFPYQYQVDNGNYQAAGTFSHIAAGAHSIVVQDAMGCMVSTSATVPVVNNLSVDAGKDVAICEGTQTTLQATSPATAFRWQPSGSASDPDLQSTQVFPLVTTKYYVFASTPICSAIDSVTVSVMEAPVPAAGEDDSVCYGKPIQLYGSGGITYHWQPAAFLSDASVPNPVVNAPAGRHQYFLSVSNTHGCQSLRSDTVTAFVTPPANVFAGHDTTVSRNLPFQLHATDINRSGFVGYQWTPSTGLDSSTDANPIATISNETTYRVTAYTADGCVGSDEVVIKAYQGPDIYVPNAFTPDKDGLNDVIRALPVGIVTFRYFKIYDRFGHTVFFTNQPSRGWDGITNGKELTAGVFVWMAAGVDFNQHLVERKGTIVLVR